MKSLERLNDVLDDTCDCGLLCDGTCLSAHGDLDLANECDSWDDCHLPVMCIWPGQCKGFRDDYLKGSVIIWDLCGIPAMQVVQIAV